MSGANMWVEDDLVGGAPPRLQSDIDPADYNFYTMYHGTSKEAAEKIKREGFRPSTHGMLGHGVYLSRDLQKASRYPLQTRREGGEGEARAVPSCTIISNPLFLHYLSCRVPMPLHPPENQRVVLRVKVNVGKVIRIDHQGHQHQKTWHDNGYDTAWCPPNCGMVPSGLEEFCVWDPKRITVIDEIPPMPVRE